MLLSPLCFSGGGYRLRHEFQWRGEGYCGEFAGSAGRRILVGVLQGRPGGGTGGTALQLVGDLPMSGGALVRWEYCSLYDTSGLIRV